MVVLSPLSEFISLPKRVMWKISGTSPTTPGIFWIKDNLFSIVYQWEEVLDALDAQITLSVLNLCFALLNSNPPEHPFAYEGVHRAR